MGLLDTNLGSLGAAGLALAAYNEQKGALDKYQTDVQTGTQTAMDRYMPRFEFKPFTVTTGTGATAGYNNGQLTMGLPQGGPEQQLQQQMFGGAADMYRQAAQDPSMATQGIYNNMYAAMQPEMQRQQLANEERMLAQGRMGISENQYGGANRESFGLAKAQQEAMNNAYMAARQQAGSERQLAGNLGQSMFTQAYLPQAQQLNAFNAAQNAAQMQQQANQQYGTTGMQTYLTGLDAQLQAQLGRSNLTGDFMTGLAAQMQPRINPVTGEIIDNTGMFGGATLNDAWGWLSKGYDWLTGGNGMTGSYTAGYGSGNSGYVDANGNFVGP